jgi:hypothetical protein
LGLGLVFTHNALLEVATARRPSPRRPGPDCPPAYAFSVTRSCHKH